MAEYKLFIYANYKKNTSNGL